MTCKKFTYSGDPSNSDLDAVRFMIGDTIRDTVMFSDDEILYQISQTPNLSMCGAELLEVKSREFARLSDCRVGDVSKSLSKLSSQMQKAADSMRNDALKRALPYFGIPDKEPEFKIGMLDNPRAIQLNEAYSLAYELLGWPNVT